MQGNINWMASREGELTNPVWEGRESDLRPFCDSGKSDSANLDGVAELLVRTAAVGSKHCVTPAVGLAESSSQSCSESAALHMPPQFTSSLRYPLQRQVQCSICHMRCGCRCGAASRWTRA